MNIFISTTQKEGKRFGVCSVSQRNLSGLVDFCEVFILSSSIINMAAQSSYFYFPFTIKQNKMMSSWIFDEWRVFGSGLDHAREWIIHIKCQEIHFRIVRMFWSSISNLWIVIFWINLIWRWISRSKSYNCVNWPFVCSHQICDLSPSPIIMCIVWKSLAQNTRYKKRKCFVARSICFVNRAYRPQIK